MGVSVQTYDAPKNETFDLHRVLICTTSDFPANGNLSGWKTEGKYTYPCYNLGTCSLYLKVEKYVIWAFITSY